MSWGPQRSGRRSLGGPARNVVDLGQAGTTIRKRREHRAQGSLERRIIATRTLRSC